jgi:hypothetical protein
MSGAAATAMRSARLAGGFYALNIVTIFAAIVLMGGGLLTGEPAQLLAHANQLRWAFSLELVSSTASIVVAALLYELLKPVHAGLALASAALRVTACAAALVGYVLQFAPLELAGGVRLMSDLDAPAQHAVALLLYRLHGPIQNLVIVLFGVHFALLGGLIWRSGYLPRPLGALALASGLAAILFLTPAAGPLLPGLAGLGLVTELSLTSWLLFRGVDAGRWPVAAA